MASVACTRCGFSNQPGYAFCVNCGSSLASAPPGPAVPYGPGSSADHARTKDADRTKTGVFLLLIGALLGWGWVPYLVAAFIAFIVVLVGAILVVVGRRSFGRAHTRNAFASILLVVFVIAANLVVFVVFLASIGAIPQGSSMSTVVAALTAAVDNYVVGLVVVGAVSGLASVLFTHALQKPLGKAILWAGYAATLGLNAAIYVIITPLVGPALKDATASGTFDPAPLNAVLDEVTTLSFLGVVSAALFATADFLAWSRIHRGEIPEKPPILGGTAPGPAPGPPAGPVPPSRP